jgi:hypothetical protein
MAEIIKLSSYRPSGTAALADGACRQAIEEILEQATPASWRQRRGRRPSSVRVDIADLRAIRALLDEAEERLQAAAAAAHAAENLAHGAAQTLKQAKLVLPMPPSPKGA